MRGRKTTTIKEYLRKEFETQHFESTSRADNLGKWMMITTHKGFNETRDKVDKTLGKLEKTPEEDEGIRQTIWDPRRKDMSLAAQCY